MEAIVCVYMADTRSSVGHDSFLISRGTSTVRSNNVLPNAAYGIKKSDEGIAILQLPDNRIHGATAGLT